MPYSIRKSGSKWITYNRNTGDIKGRHTSHSKAVKQMRLLYMVSEGENKGKVIKRLRNKRKS